MKTRIKYKFIAIIFSIILITLMLVVEVSASVGNTRYDTSETLNIIPEKLTALTDSSNNNSLSSEIDSLLTKTPVFVFFYAE